MSAAVIEKRGDRESLPPHRYTKEELLSVLSGMDASERVKDETDEEAVLEMAATSCDPEVREAASQAMVARFKYIEKFQCGKTTSAEDRLISLAVDIYKHRPTSSSFVLKDATLKLVLCQLSTFYKIEAQNFYRKSGDYRNDVEDYRQEAALCIIEKLEQYDPSKGKLSTFFKQQLYGQFVVLQAGDSKKYLNGKLNKIDRTIADLEKVGIRNPTSSQIAQWINKDGITREVSSQQVEKAMRSRVNFVPLENVQELQDRIPGTEETVLRKDWNERIRKAASELDPMLQVVYDTWIESIENGDTDVSDKDLKVAMKAKFPQMTDRDVRMAKMEFMRQMARKLGDSKSEKKVKENIKNTAEANIDLFDAIESQFPNGLPEK